jgi:hypothetical protein
MLKIQVHFTIGKKYQELKLYNTDKILTLLMIAIILPLWGYDKIKYAIKWTSDNIMKNSQSNEKI